MCSFVGRYICNQPGAAPEGVAIGGRMEAPGAEVEHRRRESSGAP